jgi:hypothetical protein
LHSFESVAFELPVLRVREQKPAVANIPQLAAPLIHGGLVTPVPPALPTSKWIVTVGSLFPPADPLRAYDCLAK